MEIKVSLKGRRLGTRQLSASFSSKELTDISGETDVIIKPREQEREQDIRR